MSTTFLGGEDIFFLCVCVWWGWWWCFYLIYDPQGTSIIPHMSFEILQSGHGICWQYPFKHLIHFH